MCSFSSGLVWGFILVLGMVVEILAIFYVFKDIFFRSTNQTKQFFMIANHHFVREGWDHLMIVQRSHILCSLRCMQERSIPGPFSSNHWNWLAWAMSSYINPQTHLHRSTLVLSWSLEKKVQFSAAFWPIWPLHSYIPSIGKHELLSSQSIFKKLLKRQSHQRYDKVIL